MATLGSCMTILDPYTSELDPHMAQLYPHIATLHSHLTTIYQPIVTIDPQIATLNCYYICRILFSNMVDSSQLSLIRQQTSRLLLGYTRIISYLYPIIPSNNKLDKAFYEITKQIKKI